MTILEVSRGFPTKRYPLNGIFEWDQAKALKDYGHEVIFAAVDLRSIRRKRKFGLQVFEQEGIKVYNYNIPMGRMPRRLLKIVSWLAFRRILKKILKTNKIDVAHYHFGSTAASKAIKAKEKFNIEYIVTEHSSDVNKNSISDAKRADLKRVYENSLYNIAVSPGFRKRMEELYGCKFEYVPNIAELSTFSAVKKIPHENFTFVSVGNLIPRKGMDITVKGFARIADKYPKSRLIIVGDGPQKTSIENLIAQLGLNERITLVGRKNRDEIAKIFTESDCFVLMSKNETFGVVYIEAMASGMPVIATVCGGPEGFVDEENGVLVEVDDVGQLCRAMEYVIENYDKYDLDKIRQYCKDNFSSRVVAEKITKILERNGN